ncbi:MAG: PIN domain-containing protein [Bryobacteraceae bacterium]|jgi:predicted nucleic acid-binding protein
MKRILFDTNVVLDVLLDRQPYVEASAAVWAAVEAGASEGMLAAHAVTTIHYLLGKELSSAKARRIVSAILRVFGVAAVDGAVVQEALQLPFSDFEDAVTAAAARLAGCECIVTRDPRGFRGSPVRALTPEAVTPLLRKLLPQQGVDAP